MKSWPFMVSLSRDFSVTILPVSYLDFPSMHMLIAFVDKPGMFDMKGRYKWDAWSKNKGMSKEEAQAKYIEHVKFLKTKYA